MLYYLAPVHSVNYVGGHYGGKAVGDDQGGAPPHQRLQRRLHVPLAGCVQGRCCLVQYQHPRLVQDDAGDGQPLPLAARQPEAALADNGVVAFGQLHYPVVYEGRFRRFHQLKTGCVGAGVEQVLLHAGVEQVALLGHVADDFRQVGQPYLPHVNAVQAHRALGYVVQAGNQGCNGGLARAAGADEGRHLPRRDPQAHAVQGPLPVILSVTVIPGLPFIPAKAGIQRL